MTGGRLAALAALAGIACGIVAAAATATPLGAASHAFAAGQCEPGNVAYTPQTPPAFALLQSELAWGRATGDGVLVAIVDSGIDAGNAHLAPVLTGGVDLVGDGERADGLSDLDGHGTAIAGIIAAAEVPGSGVRGLAPDARLLSVRVFRGRDDESIEAGFGPTVERIAAGIRVAADRGAQVVNVSLSDVPESGDLHDAVAYAHARGSLVVASAGNRTTSASTEDGPRYPAAYPEALAVATSDASGQATDASVHGPHVEVAAPGQNVLTSATGAGDCLYAADTPSSSFATAYAAAAAALVAGAHPEEGPDGWQYRLMASATRADPDRRDDALGWGVVQPYDAIALLPAPDTRGPASPFFDTSASAVRPASTAVEPDHGPSPFEATRELLLVTGVIAVAALGTLGSLLVLRRRRAEPATPTLADVRGGLLSREVDTEP
ncbi:S8 family serine peptidase [Agromyces sp. CFH 90414]|uniref:S8 family serine peptidase n=1 Tax=Agromyces agglutinans TaxID=2662258 RepID=A0A6I2F2X3_9MICO|nr:S8 family serine peptidase [Agromyces agglutinans]MRG58882.1 S8 family serine peptidase [Agromyces agglutinans]